MDRPAAGANEFHSIRADGKRKGKSTPLGFWPFMVPHARGAGGDVAAIGGARTGLHVWVGAISQSVKKREEAAGKALSYGARGFTPISAP